MYEMYNEDNQMNNQQADQMFGFNVSEYNYQPDKKLLANVIKDHLNMASICLQNAHMLSGSPMTIPSWSLLINAWNDFRDRSYNTFTADRRSSSPIITGNLNPMLIAAQNTDRPYNENEMDMSSWAATTPPQRLLNHPILRAAFERGLVKLVSPIKYTNVVQKIRITSDGVLPTDLRVQRSQKVLPKIVEVNPTSEMSSTSLNNLMVNAGNYKTICVKSPTTSTVTSANVAEEKPVEIDELLNMYCDPYEFNGNFLDIGLPDPDKIL